MNILLLNVFKGKGSLPPTRIYVSTNLQVFLTEFIIMMPCVLVLVTDHMDLSRIHPKERSIQTIEKEGPNVGPWKPCVVNTVPRADVLLQMVKLLDSFRSVVVLVRIGRGKGRRGSIGLGLMTDVGHVVKVPITLPT